MAMRDEAYIPDYWDRLYPPPEPKPIEYRCEICGRVFDPDDLVGGMCERCAVRQYEDSLGKLYALEFQDYFRQFLDGKEPDSGSELRALRREFAMDDMDEWREWLAE